MTFELPLISDRVQLPGTTWAGIAKSQYQAMATKTDGTLWMWGYAAEGVLGLNGPVHVHYSSPVQIPGTTWKTGSNNISVSQNGGSEPRAFAIKTDGTLWVWGSNELGGLGQNSTVHLSSPTQVPGTDWYSVSAATKAVQATKQL